MTEDFSYTSVILANAGIQNLKPGEAIEAIGVRCDVTNPPLRVAPKLWIPNRRTAAFAGMTVVFEKTSSFPRRRESSL